MLRILKRNMSNIFKQRESAQELVYIKKRELEKLKKEIGNKEKLLGSINKEIKKKKLDNIQGKKN